MRKNGFVSIIIVVLLAIIGIVGVYYLSGLAQSKKIQVKTINEAVQPTRLITSPTPKLTITPIIISPITQLDPDKTANWEVYTSDQFGFTFKYPGVLDLYNSSSDDYIMLLNDDYSAGLTIKIDPEGFSPDPENYTYKLEYFEDKGIYIREIRENTDVEKWRGNKDRRIIIFAPKVNIKNHWYYISYTCSKNDLNCRETFEQILSTFKFIQ